MTMREYIAALRRNWVAILVLTLLGGIGAFAYAQTLPLLYRSTASVMIIPVRGDNTAELVQGSSYVQSLVQSYAALASKPVVLQPVIDDLGLEQTPNQLAGSVSVSAPLDTVVIDISVVQHDPVLAKRIAAGITSSLADSVTRLSPKGADDKAAVRMAVIAPPEVPNAPFAPNSRAYGVIGLVIGAIVGIAYALIRRLINGRVASAEDVEDAVDVPVMGEIISTKRKALPSRALLDAPEGQVAESFRALAANLRFANVDGTITVLLISSSQPGEGKSTIASGLALAIGESGQRVLLVDGDLRRPTIAGITQFEGAVGVTTVLIGDIDLADAVQPWGPSGVDVLTSGTLPPNPGQLLASGHLRTIIDEARSRYDIIIIDSPPVLTVSDALWLADLSDGVLVAARSGKSTRRRLAQAIASLRVSHAPVIGVVLNGVKGRLSSPYYVAEQPGKGFGRGRKAKEPQHPAAHAHAAKGPVEHRQHAASSPPVEPAPAAEAAPTDAGAPSELDEHAPDVHADATADAPELEHAPEDEATAEPEQDLVAAAEHEHETEVDAEDEHEDTLDDLDEASTAELASRTGS